MKANTPLPTIDSNSNESSSAEMAQVLQQAKQEQAWREMEAYWDSTRPKDVFAGIGSGVSTALKSAVGAVGILVLSPAVGMKLQREASKGSDHETAAAVGGALGGAAYGIVQATSTLAGGVVQGGAQVVRGIAMTPKTILMETVNRNEYWWNDQDGKWTRTDLVEAQVWLGTQPENDEDLLEQIPALAEAIEEEEEFTDPDFDDDTNADDEQFARISFLTESSAECSSALEPSAPAGVTDPYYYDLLGVNYDATVSTIQRRYNVCTRKYTKGRAGGDTQAAQERRDELGTAYVVLTTESLRSKYDKYGLEFWMHDDEDEDKDEGDAQEAVVVSVSSDSIPAPPLIDPKKLYSLLYGSEKFMDYVGRLSAATVAAVGSKSSLSMAEARLLQKRRVTRLAVLLVDRLASYVGDEDQKDKGVDKTKAKKPLSDTSSSTKKVKEMRARADWNAEAEFLSKASYGTEMLHVVGLAYQFSSIQYMGRLHPENPSLAGSKGEWIWEWAQKQMAFFERTAQSTKDDFSNLAGNRDRVKVEETIKRLSQEGKGSDQNIETGEEFRQLQKDVGDAFLQWQWRQTVVDISSTLHEACSMVLNDQAVSGHIRMERAQGLKLLGEIFMQYKQTSRRPDESKLEDPEDDHGREIFEEVAFAALVETLARKVAHS